MGIAAREQGKLTLRVNESLRKVDVSKFKSVEQNLDCLTGAMAYFVYEQGLAKLPNVRYYTVSGSLDKKDIMIKVIRSLDAIGSIILDFAQSQRVVGVWATFMDPF